MLESTQVDRLVSIRVYIALLRSGNEMKSESTPLIVAQKRVRCVLVPPRGSVSFLIALKATSEDLRHERWVSQVVSIRSHFYMMLTRRSQHTDKNKMATKLIESPVHGPAVFVLLDSELLPTSVSVMKFKKLTKLR